MSQTMRWPRALVWEKSLNIKICKKTQIDNPYNLYNSKIKRLYNSKSVVRFVMKLVEFYYHGWLFYIYMSIMRVKILKCMKSNTHLKNNLIKNQLNVFVPSHNKNDDFSKFIQLINIIILNESKGNKTKTSTSVT